MAYKYELWFVSQGTHPTLILFYHLSPLQCNIHTLVSTSVFQHQILRVYC